jgi:hypothetical protein
LNVKFLPGFSQIWSLLGSCVGTGRHEMKRGTSHRFFLLKRRILRSSSKDRTSLTSPKSPISCSTTSTSLISVLIADPLWLSSISGFCCWQADSMTLGFKKLQFCFEHLLPFSMALREVVVSFSKVVYLLASPQGDSEAQK